MNRVEYGADFIVVTTPNSRDLPVLRKFFIDQTYEVAESNTNKMLTHRWRIQDNKLQWSRREIYADGKDHWMELSCGMSNDEKIWLTTIICTWIVEMGLLGAIHA